MDATKDNKYKESITSHKLSETEIKILQKFILQFEKRGYLIPARYPSDSKPNPNEFDADLNNFLNQSFNRNQTGNTLPQNKQEKKSETICPNKNTKMLSHVVHQIYAEVLGTTKSFRSFPYYIWHVIHYITQYLELKSNNSSTTDLNTIHELLPFFCKDLISTANREFDSCILNTNTPPSYSDLNKLWKEYHLVSCLNSCQDYSSFLIKQNISAVYNSYYTIGYAHIIQLENLTPTPGFKIFKDYLDTNVERDKNNIIRLIYKNPTRLPELHSASDTYSNIQKMLNNFNHQKDIFSLIETYFHNTDFFSKSIICMIIDNGKQTIEEQLNLDSKKEFTDFLLTYGISKKNSEILYEYYALFYIGKIEFDWQQDSKDHSRSLKSSLTTEEYAYLIELYHSLEDNNITTSLLQNHCPDFIWLNEHGYINLDPFQFSFAFKDLLFHDWVEISDYFAKLDPIFDPYIIDFRESNYLNLNHKDFAPILSKILRLLKSIKLNPDELNIMDNENTNYTIFPRQDHLDKLANESESSHGIDPSC